MECRPSLPTMKASPEKSNSSQIPLRTAVVGLGRIGFGYHAPSVARHSGFELVGVVDPIKERRAEAVQQWGKPAHASLEALLDSTAVDLVVVASPTPFHAQQATLAFARGAHVFCDKPVARSVAEFNGMLAAARTAGRKFLAYQPYRINPELRALESILERRLIGEPFLIRRSRCSYLRRNDWQAFRANGGGMLNNYGAHLLDEALALLRDETIRTVFCQTRSVATLGDADDVVKIVLVTSRGLLIDLEISQASAQGVAPWQVFGSLGAATWDQSAQAWDVRRVDSGTLPESAQTGLAAKDRSYGHAPAWSQLSVPAKQFPVLDYYDLAWRYFAADELPPSTPEDSHRLLALIESCRLSAEREQSVRADGDVFP